MIIFEISPKSQIYIKESENLADVRNFPLPVRQILQDFIKTETVYPQRMEES